MDRSIKAVKATSVKSVIFQSKLILIGLAIVITSMQASAATATATMPVSATVLTACLVAATPLTFGNYDIAGTAVSISSTVAVTCTGSSSYTVALGVGSGSGASFATRKMTYGAETLNYSIFTDAARTTVWGDGTSGSSTVAGTGTLGATTHTAYGTIPAAQSVNAGVYTDTVTVTLNY